MHHNTDASSSASGEHIKSVVNFPYLGTVPSSTSWGITKIVVIKFQKLWATLWSSLSKQEIIHLRKGHRVQRYPSFCMALNPRLYIRDSIRALENLDYHGKVEYCMSIFSSSRSIEALIIPIELRRIGHVIKMPEDCLPKGILY